MHKCTMCTKQMGEGHYRGKDHQRKMRNGNVTGVHGRAVWNWAWDREQWWWTDVYAPQNTTEDNDPESDSDRNPQDEE